MPIYEYTCAACGAHTEIMHKISEKPSAKCPACGKMKLQKQVSAAGFRLGGGGWYETDFKSGGKRNLAGDSADKPADKPAADAGEKKAVTASDSKPAPAASKEKKKAEPVAKPSAKPPKAAA
ncbi:MAG TPA: FmdB family zinc ribbon protein [Solimonas sp.]|nr:FmdB family zinc ribbon protein [Solimonas sp.]